MNEPLSTVTVNIYPTADALPSRRIENIPWYPGMTCLSAMVIGDAMFADTFTFRLIYKSFYGAWVDAIDGIADTTDSFWMLYVDDVLSDYGVSDTILRVSPPAHHVEVSWKYQNSHLVKSPQLTRKLSVLDRK